MNRTLKASLLITGIFACGVIVGGFGARRVAPPPAHRPPPAPDNFHPHVMRRLTSELGLDAGQSARIDPVIQRAGEELRVLRQESMRQSGAVLEKMNGAVSAELTPEQREKFEVLKEAQRARMKAAMDERQRRREASERGEFREREPRRLRDDDRRPGAAPGEASPPPPPGS
jgi:hypothetical protein